MTTLKNVAGTFISIAVTGIFSSASAAQPIMPSVEWQATAQNIASRVGELTEFAAASGDDDAKLADSVQGMKDKNVTIVRKSEANGWRTITTTTTATLANVVIVDWYVQGKAVYALAAYSKPVPLAPSAPWIP